MEKHVQEISANECEQLPERYIRKQDEEYGGNLINAHDTTVMIPVIDFSLLAASSPSELDKLKSAVTTWGCFQTINHGIESSLLEKAREIGANFFKLPMEEKRKYLREGDDFEGYGNDMILSDNQILDWNDRIYLTVVPKHQQKLQLWPQDPTHFREVLNEYSSKIDLIFKAVLKSLARSLNLEEDSFLNQYGTTVSISARYNYYPPCPWPEKVFGVKPHSDSSAITILLQDKEVEGLQVLRDNQWVGVPIVRDALTINVGQQMELVNYMSINKMKIMSNGIFKSPVHRVLVNSKKERMSLAMFCVPYTEMVIGPVDELITDETPRLFKNVTFTFDFLLENFQQGRRAIDACKI